ncbi:hypothetical protein [Paenibacillus sp.]|uniref:hypothetical protein n=1 Tax=Paenibacillus sp. TaxID=58172 RepID=UPI002810CFEE|nr:hypothetical protein [Paenibacillus sp.]
MNEAYYELESRMERSPKQRENKAERSYKWVAKAGVVALWLLLAGSAFALAYYYVGGIRAELEQIQRTNQQHIADVNGKLTQLQGALQSNQELAAALQAQFAVVESELTAVKEQMSLAGDSLSTTAESKKALNERITDLSKELEELRKSIKKLEEAARVY